MELEPKGELCAFLCKIWGYCHSLPVAVQFSLLLQLLHQGDLNPGGISVRLSKVHKSDRRRSSLLDFSLSFFWACVSVFSLRILPTWHGFFRGLGVPDFQCSKRSASPGLGEASKVGFLTWFQVSLGPSLLRCVRHVSRMGVAYRDISICGLALVLVSRLYEISSLEKLL